MHPIMQNKANTVIFWLLTYDISVNIAVFQMFKALAPTNFQLGWVRKLRKLEKSNNKKVFIINKGILGKN